MMNSSKAELSYTTTALGLNYPLRSDGRGSLDYRPIRLARGVYPQANGSARVQCGESQISVGVTCSVTTIGTSFGIGDACSSGSIVCNVSCVPTAYPSYSPSALEELSEELTSIVSDVYCSRDVLPSNLIIIPGRKIWTLNVDALIHSEDGNILDILFLAIHAALYDCRIPATRSVQYKAQASVGNESALDTRQGSNQAADFELKDYWDSGEPLSNQNSLPVAITLHLHPNHHYLDATLLEAEATQSKMLIVHSFESGHGSNLNLNLMRVFGEAVMLTCEWRDICERSQGHAKSLLDGLRRQLETPRGTADLDME